MFATSLTVLATLTFSSAASAQYGGYRPLDAGCKLDKSVKLGTQNQVKPVRGGVLSDTGYSYFDANPGEPYARASYSGERSAFGSKAKAQLDLQFTLAGMVLDAGHRWFEPGQLMGAQGASAGQFGGNLFGVNNDRILTGDVFFCDEPAKYTQDAVEVYNRLGAQLLGSKFQRRTAPAPAVLMWKEDNTIERW